MDTGKSKLLASVRVAVTTVGERVVISAANAKDEVIIESISNLIFI